MSTLTTGRAAALAAVAELAARPRRPVPEPKPFDPQDLRRRRAAAVRCQPLDDGRRDPLGQPADAARAVA